ncbi:hypothetical protein, partial [Burkholderia multivorans]|uniref:hypothetical protein n=1 Tax=Burkholderia multivorans TaxID=87883 RepID=UPI001C6558E7
AVPVHALADQTLDVVRELFVELHRALRAARMPATPPRAWRRCAAPPRSAAYHSGFAFSITLTSVYRCRWIRDGRIGGTVYLMMEA